MKRDIDNRAKARRISYVVSTFYELWSTNGLNRTGVFTHLQYFVLFHSPHTLYAALTWHSTSTLNETALSSSAAEI